jgi:hypothetical protein
VNLRRQSSRARSLLAFGAVLSLSCRSTGSSTLSAVRASPPVWLRETPSGSLKGLKYFDSNVWQKQPDKYGELTRWLMLPNLREHSLGRLDTVGHVEALLGHADEVESLNAKTYYIYKAYCGESASMRPKVAFEAGAGNRVERIAVYFEPSNDAPATPGYERAFGPDWAPMGSDLN